MFPTRIVGRRKPPSKPAASDRESDSEFPIRLGDGDSIDEISARVEAEGEKPPETPVDPIIVAARLMVLQAVGDADLLAALRSPGQLVTVEVPGPDWSEPISVAWREVVVGDARPPAEGDDGRIRWDGNCDFAAWLQFCRSGQDKLDKGDIGNGAVRAAIGNHVPITGFAPNPARHLPHDLVRAADHRVIVRPLDGATLATVVAATVGGPCDSTLPDDLCRLVDPVTLRLAQRPNQDANAYLARLQSLLTTSGPTDAGISFADLHGMDAAIRWGEALARDLSEYARGELSWQDVDKGALLAGPPGTGKTTYARALSNRCGIPLVIGSFARWQAAGTGHLGDMLAAMRKSFDDARRQAPAILFIDEIDSVGDRSQFSGHNHSYNLQVVNAFLEALDGIEGRNGVVVVGACNDPDAIDPAIRRPGRLDRLIRVELPDAAALQKIFRVHLGPDHLGDIDLAAVARMVLGASGAEVEQLVRGARRHARTERRPMIIDDLIKEIRGDSVDHDSHGFRLACVHEAGHAVATALLAPGTLQMVSVRSDAVAGADGITRTRDSGLPTAAVIETRLVALLAGRAAEKSILGEISAGAGGSSDSDLAQCTGLALASLISMGLHDEAPVWLGNPEPKDLEGLFFRHPLLAARVSEMVADAERRADELLHQHRAEILVVAHLLRTEETLGGAEVEHAVRETQKYVVETQVTAKSPREGRQKENN